MYVVIAWVKLNADEERDLFLIYLTWTDYAQDYQQPPLWRHRFHMRNNSSFYAILN